VTSALGVYWNKSLTMETIRSRTFLVSSTSRNVTTLLITENYWRSYMWSKSCVVTSMGQLLWCERITTHYNTSRRNPIYPSDKSAGLTH
jgi:hypothetical protein